MKNFGKSRLIVWWFDVTNKIFVNSCNYICQPNCSMRCLKKLFHLWKVVLVFAEKQGWGNFILKGLDRTVFIMVVQTSFFKSAFDPGIMAIWVIKFRIGYKIRQILGQKSTYRRRAIITCGLYFFTPFFSVVYNQERLILQTI